MVHFDRTLVWRAAAMDESNWGSQCEQMADIHRSRLSLNPPGTGLSWPTAGPDGPPG